MGSAAGSGVSGWFSKPEDSIPDDVKKGGPVNQMDYIDRVLLPAMKADLESDKPTIDKTDLRDLLDYRKKLYTEDLPDELKKTMSGAADQDQSYVTKINYLKEYYGNLQGSNPELYGQILESMPAKYSPFQEVNLLAPMSNSGGDSAVKTAFEMNKLNGNVPGSNKGSNSYFEEFFDSLLEGFGSFFDGLGDMLPDFLKFGAKGDGEYLAANEGMSTNPAALEGLAKVS